MDRTDLAIFTRLVDDPRRSDERLGREVGLTGKAVRLRRRRMEANGVLTEYGIHPRAELFGRTAVAWGYVGPDRRPPPVDRLLAVPDFVYLRSFRPGFHMVVRFPETPDDRPDRRLARILGRPLDGPLDDRPPVASVRPDELTATDWKILESVVRAPRSASSVQARSAGVSSRTLRLRRARLEAAGALETAMILDLEREPGLPAFGLWLKVDARFDATALAPVRLWDRPHWTRHPRGVYLLGSGANYAEARDLERTLRAVPGVLDIDPIVPAGGYFARERLLGWIRAERERRFPSRRPR